MDVRICDRLTQRQDRISIGYGDNEYCVEMRKPIVAPSGNGPQYWPIVRPINPGTHETRTALASHYFNDWNVSVWVMVAGVEYGFMEYPNLGSVTEERCY